MARSFPILPASSASGHLSASGFWHYGTARTCWRPPCKPGTPRHLRVAPRQSGKRVAAVLRAFAGTPAARAWSQYPGVDLPDGIDCDVMSARFAERLHEANLPGRALELAGPGPQYADHWVTVVGSLCVDWTARQFWNYDPEHLVDPDAIAFPLIYPATGAYPLAWVPLVPAAVTA